MWAETLLSLFLNMWSFAEGKSVCVHMCAHVCMCAYVCACVHCVCVCIHVCMHECIECMCVWECVWVCMHVCVSERERARDRETESERTNLPWGNIYFIRMFTMHLCWECPKSKIAMFALHIFAFLSNFDNIPFTSPTFSHITPIYVPSLSRKPYFWANLTQTN